MSPGWAAAPGPGFFLSQGRAVGQEDGGPADPGALEHLRKGQALLGPQFPFLEAKLVGPAGLTGPWPHRAKFSHQNTLLCLGTPAHQVSHAPAYQPVHTWPRKQGTQELVPAACSEFLRDLSQGLCLGALVSLWYNGSWAVQTLKTVGRPSCPTPAGLHFPASPVVGLVGGDIHQTRGTSEDGG